MAARRIVGVDESGKGDFFGPLVVAAFLCSDSDLPSLEQLGTRDSKKLSDARVMEIDKRLRAEFPHVVILLSPDAYNRRYAELKNLNHLLADCHARAIVAIAEKHGVDLAVSDKFGKSELLERSLGKLGCNVPLKQIVRGESIPQVAAASIIARAAFVKEIGRLSRRFHILLPKGASSKVDEAGRELVRKSGTTALQHVAKIHFKNYARVINPRLAV